MSDNTGRNYKEQREIDIRTALFQSLHGSCFMHRVASPRTTAVHYVLNYVSLACEIFLYMFQNICKKQDSSQNSKNPKKGLKFHTASNLLIFYFLKKTVLRGY